MALGCHDIMLKGRQFFWLLIQSKARSQNQTPEPQLSIQSIRPAKTPQEAVQPRALSSFKLLASSAVA